MITLDRRCFADLFSQNNEIKVCDSCSWQCPGTCKTDFVLDSLQYNEWGDTTCRCGLLLFLHPLLLQFPLEFLLLFIGPLGLFFSGLLRSFFDQLLLFGLLSWTLVVWSGWPVCWIQLIMQWRCIWHRGQYLNVIWNKKQWRNKIEILPILRFYPWILSWIMNHETKAN